MNIKYDIFQKAEKKHLSNIQHLENTLIRRAKDNAVFDKSIMKDIMTETHKFLELTEPLRILKASTRFSQELRDKPLRNW